MNSLQWNGFKCHNRQQSLPAPRPRRWTWCWRPPLCVQDFVRRAHIPNHRQCSRTAAVSTDVVQPATHCTCEFPPFALFKMQDYCTLWKPPTCHQVWCMVAERWKPILQTESLLRSFKQIYISENILFQPFNKIQNTFTSTNTNFKVAKQIAL